MYSYHPLFPPSPAMEYAAYMPGLPQFGYLEQANLLRTVILRGLAAHVTLEEVLDEVDHGPIEACGLQRTGEHQACAVSFVSPLVLVAFFHKYARNSSNLQVLRRRLRLRSMRVVLDELHRGREYMLPKTVNYIADFGATRCVALRVRLALLLVEDPARELELATCARFGAVEHYRTIRSVQKVEMRVVVHFAAIDAAIRAYEHYLRRVLRDADAEERADLNGELPPSVCLLVAFHKDRCDRTDVSEPAEPADAGEPADGEPAEPADLLAPMDGLAFESGSDLPEPHRPPRLNLEDPYAAYADTPGNRTVHLGGLHRNTTAEEVANNVRAGGLVESIKLLRDKRMCFVTFVDAAVALKFYVNHQVLHQLVIHNTDVTVSWCRKHSGPLRVDIGLAVTAGALRNVYIGVKKDDALVVPDEATLRADFAHFGELEQINFYNNCGFVNFMHIASAIAVVDMFENADVARLSAAVGDSGEFYNRYKHYKIAFGKDRCGLPPKFNYRKTFKGDGARERDYVVREPPRRHAPPPKELAPEAMAFGISTKDDDDSDAFESCLESMPPATAPGASPAKSILSTPLPPHKSRPQRHRVYARLELSDAFGFSLRNSLLLSLNSPHAPYYNYPPQAPTFSPQHMYFPPSPTPGYRGYSAYPYAMTGLLVMAQYLAKAQHDNYMYAASLMNSEAIPEETYFRRRGRR